MAFYQQAIDAVQQTLSKKGNIANLSPGEACFMTDYYGATFPHLRPTSVDPELLNRNMAFFNKAKELIDANGGLNGFVAAVEAAKKRPSPVFSDADEAAKKRERKY